jgi:type IV secretory pathway VirB3-like protein
MQDPSTKRMASEDVLHVGNTRPERLVGLPFPLAVVLIGAAYLIQINVTGWQGIMWAVAIVGPCWGIAYIAVAHDPYGINVIVSWIQSCALLRDRARWGGASCSPLPAHEKKKGGGL